MSRSLFSLLAVCALAGCASDPVGVSYYLLSAPPPAASATATVAAAPVVVLERIELAEFLRQSGLVMQVGANQMEISRTHLWAESPEQALPKRLLAVLQQAPDFRFFLPPGEIAPNPDWQVRLRIDAFHATADGEVIAAGRYQLIGAAGDVLRGGDFRFAEDLDADGYAHAVARLQVLVDRLGQTLLAALRETAATTNSR